MKPLRVFLTALAAVIVAGTVASASPGIRGAFDDEPSPEATVSPEPTASPETAIPPEPTGSPSPSPSVSESSPSDPAAQNEDGSEAPDFAGCEGLTGLDNAICRHDALLVVRPDDTGLQNALAHLEANQAKHAEEAKAAETDGSEESNAEDADEAESSCPGHSCDEHGNGHSKP